MEQTCSEIPHAPQLTSSLRFPYKTHRESDKAQFNGRKNRLRHLVRVPRLLDKLVMSTKLSVYHPILGQ